MIGDTLKLLRKQNLSVRWLNQEPDAPDWDKHLLYRIFDHGETLLYAGMTSNFPQRMIRHQATQSWWGTVDFVSVESYADRESLRNAEREAIFYEKPKHNRIHPFSGAPVVEIAQRARLKIGHSY